MRGAMATVAPVIATVPCTFSFSDRGYTRGVRKTFHDEILELHCWMTHWNDFIRRGGLRLRAVRVEGVTKNLVRNGERNRS